MYSSHATVIAIFIFTNGIDFAAGKLHYTYIFFFNDITGISLSPLSTHEEIVKVTKIAGVKTESLA